MLPVITTWPGLGRALHTRCDVGGLADDVGGQPGRAGTHLADDDEPGVHTDPCGEIVDPKLGGQSRHLADDAQPGAHRLDGVLFMGHRKAEVGEDPVALVVGDEAVVGGDRGDAARLVAEHHLAQVFGVEATGEGRRPDEVDEHHREVASLALAASTVAVGQGERVAERRTAAVAESVVRSVLFGTGGAGPNPRRTTPPAEPGGSVDCPTARCTGRRVSQVPAT